MDQQLYLFKNLRLRRSTVERVESFAEKENRKFNNMVETMLILEIAHYEKFGKHSWQ